MGFKINQTCYLHNISLFIIDVKKPFYLDFEIYNAKWTTRIEPNQQIYFKDNLDLQNQAGNAWKTITLNSALTLNLTETKNQTFFIALSQYTSPPQAKELAWGYHPSIGENGYGPAYNWTGGTIEPLEFDFSMRVRVSASNDSEPEIVYPSQINLKINGIQVQNSTPPAEGKGVCTITGNFDSSEILILNFTSTWFDTVSFNASVEVYGVNLFGNILMASLLQGYSLGSMFQAEDRNNTFLIICAVGAVAVAGFSGYRANKKRKIPINAMRSMESILVDHNPTGGLVWSFNFISMQQDTALVSGFMSAIKTFLEEMKVGGLKRMGTDFGTFIREESQLLTATCIAGEIGIDEEFWIRSKLHEFLVKVEQSYYKELQDWKGNVAQFRESFPVILGSLISLDRVQKLQLKKMEKLAKNRDKVHKKVNKYGEKLEKLKAKYDAGEMDFKGYIIERYKTEAKFERAQREYIYVACFYRGNPLSQSRKRSHRRHHKRWRESRKGSLRLKRK